MITAPGLPVSSIQTIQKKVKTVRYVLYSPVKFCASTERQFLEPAFLRALWVTHYAAKDPEMSV